MPDSHGEHPHLHRRLLSLEPRPRRLGLGGARRRLRLGSSAEDHQPAHGADRRDGGASSSISDEIVEIVSDSTYVVKCFQDRWWAGWKRRGWKNSQGQPVANRDLWEPLLELALDPARQISFTLGQGALRDRWNDVVDELALKAAKAQQGASGSRA